MGEIPILLPFVVVLLTLTPLAAAALAWARGPRSGLALLAFYAPQALLLLWVVGDLARWGVGEGASVGAVAALATLLAHRLRTYAGQRRPVWGDLVSFSVVHVVQTVTLMGLVAWPLSRLLPASAALDFGVIAALALGAAVALLWTHTALALVQLSVVLPGLSRTVRVVQISDLHVGPYTPAARLQQIAAEVTLQAPDLIALTGDLLTLRSEGDLSGLLEFVDALPLATLGIWACLGNHDVSARATWLPALEARGVRVLVDAAVDLEEPRLRVVGLDWRSWRDRASYGPAMERLSPADGRSTLLLCHDPSAFDRLPGGWRGVMLAGHLHGGQVGWRLGDRTISPLGLLGLREQGLHRRGDVAMYVHRGTGTYGFPVRFGVAPEVAQIELRPGDAT